MEIKQEIKAKEKNECIHYTIDKTTVDLKKLNKKQTVKSKFKNCKWKNKSYVETNKSWYIFISKMSVHVLTTHLIRNYDHVNSEE